MYLHNYVGQVKISSIVRPLHLLLMYDAYIRDPRSLTMLPCVYDAAEILSRTNGQGDSRKRMSKKVFSRAKLNQIYISFSTVHHSAHKVLFFPRNILNLIGDSCIVWKSKICNMQYWPKISTKRMNYKIFKFAKIKCKYLSMSFMQ